ncbi:hypothetical protein BV25DRAFT_1910912 [Artomyces pyxidatus]|uniref:Uncharacterized protein n=1 Tax=Artomyces pyxidatus TaxID=48021 RepID=A0ACB8TL81_9AGAM|nr:hypothetical protein BV25DRAFT_1910912 [Artomyces pyxidatus]
MDIDDGSPGRENATTQQQSEESSAPRYTTRPTNERNPAKKFGLQKRTLAEIQTVSQQKKSVKDKKTKEKQDLEHTTRLKEAAGARIIARAIDQHTQRSRLDEEYGNAPGSDEDDEVAEDGLEEMDSERSDESDVSRPKKLSTAAKKQIRASAVRAQIDQHRIKNDHAAAARAVSQKKRKSGADTDEAQYKRAKKSLQGLDNEWVAQQGRKPKNQAEGLEMGGFSDEDVVTHREDVAHMENSARNESVGIVENEAADAASESDAPQAKAPRRPKTPRDKKKSTSVDNLPPFIQPHFETTILPSLRALVGSLENPWELDYKDEQFFFSHLQDILRDVLDDPGFELSKSSSVYRVARSKIHDWRAHFLLKALSVIKTEIVHRFGGKSRKADAQAKALTKNKKDINHYVEQLAMEWFWEEPHSEPPTGVGLVTSATHP